MIYFFLFLPITHIYIYDQYYHVVSKLSIDVSSKPPINLYHHCDQMGQEETNPMTSCCCSYGTSTTCKPFEISCFYLGEVKIYRYSHIHVENYVFYELIIMFPCILAKTRPDTRQSSRGRFGRGGAKTARNSKM